MLHAMRSACCCIVPAVTMLLFGCQDQPKATTAPSASAAPSAAPPAPSSAPAPMASAPKPSHACPDGSTGEGTFKNPCEAKGAARLMDVAWTGKMTDTGPSFRVANKSKLDIVYGALVVYFYDKAGKQLETNGKPTKTCPGYIFSGPMKAGEKAVLTFSCVGKSSVPEGTTVIEGELQMVGFPDADGKKADTYWRNSDLTPDARPKGGVK